MKICFLARPYYDKFATALYKTITRELDASVRACFITSDSEETEYVKGQVRDAEVHEVADYLCRNWDSFTVERLVELEGKYDCAPIWKYIYTDRFLVKRDADYAIHVAAGLLSFFEDIFSCGDIDFYYSEAIATFQCYAAYIVGKKLGVRYISQMVTRGFDSSHHYFMDDPFERNMLMQADDGPPSPEELAEADAFLSEFESRDIPPRYMAYTGAKPRLTMGVLATPAKRLIRSFSTKYTNPYSYMYYQGHKHITDPLSFYVKYKRARKYYSAADLDKRFVYFPLHFQPEASTLVCAQKYEKQLFFIDSLAKSLPADTLLYVKEHYAFLGHRDLSFYKDLAQYPNVVLIDPWESSRVLIEKSQAVATLTGTAGWEAMLLRKPVIIAGNIFFDDAPGVMKVDDIYGKYISLIDGWSKPARDKVLNYLCRYMRSLRVGAVSTRPEVYLDQENLLAMSKSLYEVLVKLQQ